MADESNDDEGKKHPPINGVEYPEKPEDPTDLEIYQYFERVDRYFQEKGFQKLEHNQQDTEESNDEQG